MGCFIYIYVCVCLIIVNLSCSLEFFDPSINVMNIQGFWMLHWSIWLPKLRYVVSSISLYYIHACIHPVMNFCNISIIMCLFYVHKILLVAVVFTILFRVLKVINRSTFWRFIFLLMFFLLLNFQTVVNIHFLHSYLVEQETARCVKYLILVKLL